MVKVMWTLEARPPSLALPEGAPEQQVVVDLVGDEWRWFDDLGHRILESDPDEQTTFVGEDGQEHTMRVRAMLCNEFRTIMDALAETGAHFRDDRGEATVEPQEALGQESLFSAMDASSEVGQAMQGAWEAQRRKHGMGDDEESLRAGRAARDEAMGRVERHAEPDWKARALAAIQTLATAQERLTSDDVWRYLDGSVPHEPRAMGPLMRQAANRGWIAKVEGEQREGTRQENHARPQQVWRSLIYVPGMR